MQIACPNCSTTYQIAATAIGASGRSVRCGRCQNVWFVPSPGVIPTISEHAVAATEAPANGRIQAPPQEPATTVSENHGAAVAGAPDGSADHAAQLPLGGADVHPAAPDAPDDAAEAPNEHVALSDIAIPVTDAPPLAPEPG